MKISINTTNDFGGANADINKELGGIDDYNNEKHLVLDVFMEILGEILGIKILGIDEVNSRASGKGNSQVDKEQYNELLALVKKMLGDDEGQSNNFQVFTTSKNGEEANLQGCGQLSNAVQQVITLQQKGFFELISNNQPLFNKIAKDAGNQNIIVTLKEHHRGLYEIASITVGDKPIDLKSDQYKDFLPSRNDAQRKAPTPIKPSDADSTSIGNPNPNLNGSTPTQGQSRI